MTVTLTIRTRAGGVLADVTAVQLSDPTGTFGLRAGQAGEIVVADGTAMTPVAAGVYRYEVELPAAGASYTWWAEIVYRGRTIHVQRLHTVPLDIEQAAVNEFDAVDLDDPDLFLTQYGEPVTVYPPIGQARSVTGIVNRKGTELKNDSRARLAVTSVSLRNDATLGISLAEWNERFTISVARFQGGEHVRMRTIRPTDQTAAFVTWEVR